MTRLSLTLAAIVAGLGLSGAKASAAVVDLSTLVQWKISDGGNGHFYALTNTASTWTDTYAVATTMGGDLVSIASAAENDFLSSAFDFTASPASIYWIGLRRTGVGGAFGWTDGTDFTYANWQPGEPNNDRNIENYAAINWYAGNLPGSPLGTWNDTPNEGVLYADPTPQPYRGIVEFSSNPLAVPEPAAWTLMVLGFGLAGRSLRCRRAALGPVLDVR